MNKLLEINRELRETPDPRLSTFLSLFYLALIAFLRIPWEDHQAHNADLQLRPWECREDLRVHEVQACL